jgi:sarcosine oxidase subunit beta
MTSYREADVVVIGGGIMGCSTDYELAKKGKSVILLESGFIGGETSGRNAGGVRQQYRHPSELPLAMESVKIWKGLEEELDCNLEYRQGGHIFIMGDGKNFEDAIKKSEFERSMGLEVQILTPKETKALIKILPKNLEIIGSKYCPSDGTANPLLVTKAIARAARRLGAQVMEHEPLKQLKIKFGRVVAASTEHNEYRASVFVNSAGAWARPICNQIGLDFPVDIKRAQILITESLPPVFNEFIGTDLSSAYFRQALKGGILIWIQSAPIVGYNNCTP